jgi:hypothetical protein
MAVGGIAIKMGRYHDIVEEITQLNSACRVQSEVKWSTFKKRRDNIHEAYVDYLHTLVGSKLAHFHMLFAPFFELDHRRSGPRKRIDSVSKMHYQLLLHRAVKYYGPTCDIYVRCDNGDCTSYLPKMRDALNNDGYLRFGCPPQCVKSIEPTDSKKEPLLQLLDVSLGALAAFKNGRHLDLAASEHKTLLAIRTAGLWGSNGAGTNLPTLAHATPLSQRHFTLWNLSSRG